MSSGSIILTPEQVEGRLKRLGLHCNFSPEEHDLFATTPVVPDSDVRVFAFPTPDCSELSLRKIRAVVGTDPKHQPSIFDHEWYVSESFMDRICPPGWHVLTMDVLADSVGQDLNYIRSRTTFPLAIEVVLMLFLHYAETAEQVLAKKHTWCAETASRGRRVTVGAFGRNGVFISGHPENFVSRGLGCCGVFPAATP
jgi:hypothetical protein